MVFEAGHGTGSLGQRGGRGVKPGRGGCFGNPMEGFGLILPSSPGESVWLSAEGSLGGREPKILDKLVGCRECG